MRTVSDTTRWLITASLIASLSLVGLFPQMVASAKSGARGTVTQPPTKCCCGTEDGRCCGMACCLVRQAPPKEPCPSPNPKDTRDGQGNPLALAAAKTMLDSIRESGGSRFGRPVGQANFSLAELTLQGKHIRIDA